MINLLSPFSVFNSKGKSYLVVNKHKTSFKITTRVNKSKLETQHFGIPNIAFYLQIFS